MIPCLFLLSINQKWSQEKQSFLSGLIINHRYYHIVTDASSDVLFILCHVVPNGFKLQYPGACELNAA
jgi:hypothetical protein